MLTTVLYALPMVRLIPLSTAALTMRLEDLSNLFWGDVAMVIQGVEPLVERLLALRAEIPLATVRSFTMFMSAGMTTQMTFHRSCCGVNILPLYLTHHNLMHYHNPPR